jgi:glyoxylase-like metal-dependent hydrolase (beta-lactamase superfamily II)
MQVRGITVGQIQENCYVARQEDAAEAIVVDPGDEAERILAAVKEIGAETVGAILLTHTHFDHVGAVAPLARETGAKVWCPKVEVPVLADINRYTWPGIGPFESYDADHTVEGGETLSLCGIELEVIFTPGHSPGHVTYAVEHTGAEPVLFSGDVLFQGSVGRTDLPGGDWPTLARSIATLLERFPDETTVLPGHMGVTTLGRERATNPFLAELV